MSEEHEWKEWDGVKYEKKFYDALLPDGTVVIHCWPNAGKLIPINGGGSILPYRAKFRPSTTHPMDGHE